jgi:hypothetical protein
LIAGVFLILYAARLSGVNAKGWVEIAVLSPCAALLPLELKEEKDGRVNLEDH